MNIGLSSATFYPKVYTENSFEIMKKLEFDAGEIFLNSFCEYDENFIKVLLEKKEKYEFDIISVHAFGSPFEPFLFDKYDRRRKDVREIFIKVCKAAKALGAKYYTFHGMRYENMKDLDKKFIVDIYDELAYEANESGISLAQENVSWCMSSSPEFLLLLKENCKYPVKYTFDIKQAYKAGIDSLVYINLMGKDLCNIHINDRDDKNICLLPGKGSVDYNTIFTGLKDYNYNGDMIIEVYNNNYINESELTDSKNYIQKLSNVYF
jgi:Sugar phosphate isomerases/epimerases